MKNVRNFKLGRLIQLLLFDLNVIELTAIQLLPEIEI